MFNSANQNVQIVSDESVKVRINPPKQPAYITKTPAYVSTTASSFQELYVEVIDPCYEHSVHTAVKSVTPVYALNILNFYGFGIDYLSGYMWDYLPSLYLPLNRKTGNVEGCKNVALSETGGEPRSSRVIRPFRPDRNRYNTLGLNIVTGSVWTSQNRGIKLYYSHKLSENVLARISFNGDGISNSDTQTSSNIYISNFRDTRTLSLLYRPPELKYFYLGMGLAHSHHRVNVSDYGLPGTGDIIEENVEGSSYPVLFDIGLELGNKIVFFDINAQLSLATLGLAPVEPKLDRSKFTKFDLATQQRVREIYNHNKDYSSVSLGIGVRF
ncbi:MAG: hypothetical protein OEX00_00360 [Gammaproteobacteria bacterium]|nr:hypothetical protein [Gammaproteobacteria bacterium]MDH5693408.1 hypothetical protein [Gammaproteobacteria bacterium]